MPFGKLAQFAFLLLVSFHLLTFFIPITTQKANLSLQATNLVANRLPLTLHSLQLPLNFSNFPLQVSHIRSPLLHRFINPCDFSLHLFDKFLLGCQLSL